MKNSEKSNHLTQNSKLTLLYCRAATSPGLSMIVDRQAEVGGGWVSLPLLKHLWEISTPGGQYARVQHYLGGRGIYVDPKTKTITWLKLQRGTDHVGRFMFWRHFWIMNASDATRLSYDWNRVSPPWDNDVIPEKSVEIQQVRLRQETAHERLQPILRRNRDNDLWTSLLLLMVSTIARKETPLLIQESILSSESLLDLVNAVGLVLPPVWRSHFNFVTGVYELPTASASVVFTLNPKHNRCITSLEMASQALKLGEPNQDYVRLLKDALKENRVAELLSEAALIQDEKRPSNEKLAAQLYRNIGAIYDRDRIRELLLKRGASNELKHVLYQLKPGSLSLSAICTKDTWLTFRERSDWLRLSSNYRVLYDWLTNSEQKKLEKKFAEVIEGKFEDAPIKQKIVILNSFPWSSSTKRKFQTQLLTAKLRQSDAQEVFSLIQKLEAQQERWPFELLKSKALPPLSEAILVAAYWDKLNPIVIRIGRYRVQGNPKRSWIVDSVSSPLYLLEAAQRIERYQPYILRVKDRLYTLQLRPYIDGVTFGDGIGDYSIGDVKKILNEIAITLQELHSLGHKHNDLKSENIILNRHGEPVLVDSIVHDSRKNFYSKSQSDNEAFVQLIFLALEKRGIQIGNDLKRSIQNQNKTQRLTFSQTLAEVWSMIEYEQFKKYLTKALGEPEIQAKLTSRHPADRRGYSVPNNELARLKRSIQELQKEVKQLQAQMRNRPYSQQYSTKPYPQLNPLGTNLYDNNKTRRRSTTIKFLLIFAVCMLVIAFLVLRACWSGNGDSNPALDNMREKTVMTTVIPAATLSSPVREAPPNTAPPTKRVEAESSLTYTATAISTSSAQQSVLPDVSIEIHPKEDKVVMYKFPRTDSHSSKTLGSNDTLIAKGRDEKNNWLYIKVGEEMGWILREDTDLIDEQAARLPVTQ